MCSRLQSRGSGIFSEAGPRETRTKTHRGSGPGIELQAVGIMKSKTEPVWLESKSIHTYMFVQRTCIDEGGHIQRERERDR